MDAYANYEFFLVTSPSAGVANVEINRPQRLNAFSRPVWLELQRLFEQLGEDREVRAVVLSGKGDRAFTAGLDVREAGKDLGPDEGKADLDPARKAKTLRARIYEFQDAVTSMEKCAKRESRYYCYIVRG